MGNPQDSQGDPSHQSGVGIATCLLHKSQGASWGRADIRAAAPGEWHVFYMAGSPDKHRCNSQQTDFTDPCSLLLWDEWASRKSCCLALGLSLPGTVPEGAQGSGPVFPPVPMAVNHL